ncbi:transposase family protein [Streptomyces griseoviridis]|nr:transposase family protein [Streptomyces niveoruber]
MGLSAGVIVEFVAELGPLWHGRHQAELASRRGSVLWTRTKHRLVFVDRLLATLVHLRHAATHDVLPRWFSVGLSPSLRPSGLVVEVRC